MAQSFFLLVAERMRTNVACLQYGVNYVALCYVLYFFQNYKLSCINLKKNVNRNL